MMTDENFLTTLEALRAYAAQRSDETFRAGDRKLFEIWDSRLNHLKMVRGFEDLQRDHENLRGQIDKLGGSR